MSQLTENTLIVHEVDMATTRRLLQDNEHTIRRVSNVVLEYNDRGIAVFIFDANGSVEDLLADNGIPIVYLETSYGDDDIDIVSEDGRDLEATLDWYGVSASAAEMIIMDSNFTI